MAVKGREVKSKGEKERYTHLNTEFQIARSFLSDQCKEIEENNRMEKSRDLWTEEPGFKESTWFQRVGHD